MCVRFFPKTQYEGWRKLKAGSVPVSTRSVNGALLVFPLSVYRLTEYVVPGCRPEKQTVKQLTLQKRELQTIFYFYLAEKWVYLWRCRLSCLLGWSCWWGTASRSWAWLRWGNRWWVLVWISRWEWRRCPSRQRCERVVEDSHLHRAQNVTDSQLLPHPSPARCQTDRVVAAGCLPSSVVASPSRGLLVTEFFRA